MRMLLLVLALFVAHPAQAEVVDRVLYVVEDQVVLLSDVALDVALTPLDGAVSPFWDRPGVSPEQRVVDAAIIRELAGDVALYQPPDEQVRARAEAIRQQFPDRAHWTTFLLGWGLDEDGLRAQLRRRMVVERYLARTLRADPSDQASWWVSCNALLTEVRPRMRIRYVPTRGQTPP